VRKKSICGPWTAGLAFVLAALLAHPALGRAQTGSYLDFDDLTRELRSLVNGSDMARMESAGKSHEGRDIWVVELADRSGKPLEQRPALLLAGNLEGNHLVGSALALETIRYLLNGSDDPEIATILTEQVIYVFPRVNPDGAEAMFVGVEYERTRNALPFDDDNDGRIDEDGPEDLNGDGMITVMRVADPSGAFMIDPADGRLMKRADPSKGEQGEYALYWEGTDSDGDGFINEDGPGGVDLNRNFQHEYPYWERDAGPYMVSEPESRALMDFVLAHRNIAAILAFGLTDNLVTPPDSRGNLADARTLDLLAFADASNAEIFEVGVFGGQQPGFGFGFGGFRFGGGSRFRGAQPGRDNDPSAGRRPVTTVNSADQEYFKTVSEAYKSITGIESVGVHRAPEGAFFQYGYFQFGVPSFSTPGWGMPKAAEAEPAEEGAEGAAAEAAPPAPSAGARPAAAGGRPQGMARAGAARGRPGGGAAAGGGGIDAQLLSAMDDAGIEAFVDWTAHDHPSLGDVEIGGFMPYTVTNPPPAELAELGAAHGQFVARLAGMLPRVTIAETEVTAHGGGIFTVAVEVENAGYFPTTLQHGVVARSVDPTTVQIQVPPEDVITGADKTSTIQQLDGSHNRERFEWVIRGRDGATVEITVRAQKGGTDSASVTLR
jgi:hypothetical protein